MPKKASSTNWPDLIDRRNFDGWTRIAGDTHAIAIEGGALVRVSSQAGETVIYLKGMKLKEDRLAWAGGPC